MIDLKATATRKLGPLPVWAWGGVIGGAILIARAMRSGGATGTVHTIGGEGASFDAESISPSGGSAGGTSVPLPLDVPASVPPLGPPREHTAPREATATPLTPTTLVPVQSPRILMLQLRKYGGVPTTPTPTLGTISDAIFPR